MTSRSTLYQVVEAQLNEQGTSAEVLIPDMLESGVSFDDITKELRDRTHVPLSSRTVRRWAKAMDDGIAA